MRITESKLRKIIRSIILEKADQKEKKDKLEAMSAQEYYDFLIGQGVKDADIDIDPNYKRKERRERRRNFSQKR